MIYPDINLLMNNIRILNNKDISLSFILIYFMTYSYSFLKLIILWPEDGPEQGPKHVVSLK